MVVLTAQNSVTPISLQSNATFQHIAIHFDITGDDNLNSAMSITYRELGSSDPFLPSAKTMRAEPNMVVDGNSLNRNFHAGSIFFLQPGTTYEINVNLIDPDGGNDAQTIEVTTREIPEAYESAVTKHVSPGNGGGTGSVVDPYLGLQYASDQAQAGDVFLVAAGNYSSFSINTDGTDGMPIVFRSDEIHQAIIDGAGTSTGIVTLGVYNDSLQHIIIDGFLIKNGRWAIDAQNTQYLTIRNNKIEDADYGIVNRRANGWEHDQYVVNNSWSGNTVWPQTGGQIPSERCIDLRGNRNVVSFNFITNFGDGISVDGPPYSVSKCMDVHNNDITKVVDDAIEVDGSVSNSAVYLNRCFNARMGVSVAPILGGPCYVFRNIFYNLETSAIKMNRSPAGLVICHNTSLKTGNGNSSPGGWQNTYLRNNIIMGDRYCFEEYDLVAGSIDDWDYNAYYSPRNGTSGEPWFKWDNVRYDDVVDLGSGTSIEGFGMETTPSDLTNTIMPSDYSIEYFPMDIDLMPISGSTLINSGNTITHLNDIFVSDGQPDRGALEFGMPAPVYGPDFSLYSSVEFNTTTNSINIFPNPATHFITLTGSLSNYDINILSANGTLVDTIDNSGTHEVIDISHLGEGLYFIELINSINDQIYVRKIVKYN